MPPLTLLVVALLLDAGLASAREQGVVLRHETVEVTARRPRPFSHRLTREDLDRLPDDPAEIEALLRGLAGEQALIRVDGFPGASLPRPSQIREIRIRMSTHAAEHHEPAGAVIDVVTEPAPQPWHGGLSAGLPVPGWSPPRPGATLRAKDDQSRLGWDASGSVLGGRALLSTSGQIVAGRRVSAIVALGPDGAVPPSAESTLRSRGGSLALTSTLGAGHVLRFEIELGEREQAGLGVSGLDLPERTYSQRHRDGHVGLSASSRVGTNATHDARLRWTWLGAVTEPASLRPTLDVPGVFRAGGASLQGTRRNRLLELADDFRWSGERLSLDLGGLLEAEWLDSRELWNSAGTFTFDSLESFRAGMPARFAQRVDSDALARRDLRAGAYAQAELALGSRWWVGAGLRYELQTGLGGWGTLAPRLDLSFSPQASGATSVRLGGGLFHEWLDPETLADAQGDERSGPYDWIVRAPAYPGPLPAPTADVGTRLQRLVTNERLPLPSLALASLSVDQRVARNVFVTVSYDAVEGRAGLKSRWQDNVAAGNGRRIIGLESSARQASRSITSSLRVGRPGGRVWWFGTHVWARSVNDADSPLSVEPGQPRGVSRNDVRHRMSSGLNLRVTKGLCLNARLSGRSGLPLDVTSALDLNGDGLLNDRPEGFRRNSRRQPGSVGADAGLRWSLAPGRGAQAAGAAGSGGGTRPARAAWRIDLSAQVTNLLDRRHGDGLVGVRESPLFGRPTTTSPGRRVTASASFRF